MCVPGRPWLTVLSAITIVTLVATRTAPAGIVAHWTFDQDGSEATGTHHATLQGGAAISSDGDAAAGESLVLDGDDDWAATAAHSADFDLQAGSISIWFKAAPSSQGTWFDLMDYHHGSVHAGGPHAWTLQGYNSGAGDITWALPGGGTQVASANALLDGQWHHLVMTFSSAPGETRAFLDGELAVVGVSTSNIPYPEQESVYFGRWGGAPAEGIPPNDRDFNGRLDDIQIYDDVLDACAVAYLFQNPGSVIPANLCCSDCPGDLDSSTTVDVVDLLALLAAWGTAGCPEDINTSGAVDVVDLLMLLAHWGGCVST